MDSETMLKKVNDRLFIEPYKDKDGKEYEIKWKKELDVMWLDLVDVKLGHTFSIEHPVFDVKYDIATGKAKEGDKLPFDKYEKQEWRVIRATGRMAKYTCSVRTDTISLILADGAIKERAYSEIKIYIRRLASDLTQDDVEDQKVNGFLGHWKDDGELYLDIGVPPDVFDSAYRELQEKQHKEVSLCVYADTFNTESERAFRPPDMPREFYIEVDSRNFVYFKSLTISEHASQAVIKDTSSADEMQDVEKRVRWFAQDWYKWAEILLWAGQVLIVISFGAVVLDWWNGQKQATSALGLIGIGCVLIAILHRLEAVLEEMTRK